MANINEMTKEDINQRIKEFLLQEIIYEPQLTAFEYKVLNSLKNNRLKFYFLNRMKILKQHINNGVLKDNNIQLILSEKDKPKRKFKRLSAKAKKRRKKYKNLSEAESQELKSGLRKIRGKVRRHTCNPSGGGTLVPFGSKRVSFPFKRR